MAFIRCDCGWQQDDFWDQHPMGYSPLRADAIAELQRTLFEPSVEAQLEEGGGSVHVRGKDYVAHELRRIIARITGMEWITHEDFKNDPDPKCPKCGKADGWTID